MYQTRHQTALHQDENIKNGRDSKATTRVANGKVVGANNRRALGDIGNVVQAGHGRQNKETEGESKKTLQPPVGRPITRSFGAQLANKKSLADASIALQPSKEEIKADNVPVKSSKTAPKERKGRTLTSTLTAQSESLCGEKKEELPNIDAEDVGNQLAVVDFVEDIYTFYRKTEAQSCVPPDYMSRQTNINHNMRAILVDWLIEVHLKFKLMPETLFLTTNIIDRYLAMQSVERKRLQLVGMTALLIASKYEELWAPEVNDFVYISDNAYTREQILDMEKTMLNILRFNLCVPTPYVFVVRFLKAAKSDQKLEMLSFYYTELSLVSYEMVKFCPSLLAASAVYTAQNTLKSEERQYNWSKLLKHHSGYTESQLMECSNKMMGLHEKSGGEGGNLSMVKRKYSLEKYGFVALLKPVPPPQPITI